MKKIFIIIITILFLPCVAIANERFIPLELFTGGEIRDDQEIRYTSADTIFGEKRRKNYYVNESVGIASGFLLAALHQSGLATLTHTPSPMGFLEKILERPKNERAVLLIPVGYPAKDSMVPILKKKDMNSICTVI